MLDRHHEQMQRLGVAVAPSAELIDCDMGSSAGSFVTLVFVTLFFVTLFFVTLFFVESVVRACELLAGAVVLPAGPPTLSMNAVSGGGLAPFYCKRFTARPTIRVVFPLSLEPDGPAGICTFGSLGGTRGSDSPLEAEFELQAAR